MLPARIIAQEFDISFKEAQNLLEESDDVEEILQANRLLFGEFLNVYTDRLNTFRRFKKTFQFRGMAFSAVKEELIFDGEEISAAAANIKLNRAINKTSSILIQKIMTKDKYIHMPRYLIGLPNYRGHCFFIPAFVPLFNNYLFVEALNAGFNMATEYIQGLRLPRPESMRERFSALEAPFLWTRIIKRFFHAYKKASYNGHLNIENFPIPLDTEYPEIYSQMVRQYRSQNNYRDDLRLDRNLMKIVLELADYKSKSYETPGGFVTHLYRCIIGKLDYEYTEIGQTSPFNKLFFTVLAFDYMCHGKEAHLGIVKLKKRLSLPSIRFPSQHERFKSLQDICDHHQDLILFQEDSCKEVKQSMFFIDSCFALGLQGKARVNIRIIESKFALGFQGRSRLNFCD
ncbi:uncharacterized protein LOC107365387 [Tetranychus urticae]|uniref:uncharacterized protein LOC107365387 n=1 Tax=Tetranychus urticae TaxID=32264 RepID=UPI000D646E11|nr:uncharacterized protein LOC107365387 [Tetranychus urticae]